MLSGGLEAPTTGMALLDYEFAEEYIDPGSSKELSSISAQGELVQVNVRVAGISIDAKKSYFSIEYDQSDTIDYPTFAEAAISQGGRINHGGETTLSIGCIDDTNFEYSYYLTLNSEFDSECSILVYNGDQRQVIANALNIYKEK